MSELASLAKRIYLETLQSIDPSAQLRQMIRVDEDRLIIGDDQIDLSGKREVVLIGLGKACGRMAAALEALLGDRIHKGVLVSDRRPRDILRSRVLIGGHPLPDQSSLQAGLQIIEILQSCSSDAVVIFLVSGGGSAMVELPIDNAISLDDLRLANTVLTRCGASIREINFVRKAVSRVKAGGLGQIVRDRQVVALYVSDVGEGDIESVASNPVLPEALDLDSLAQIMDRYRLHQLFPESINKAIDARLTGQNSSSWNWEVGPPILRMLSDNSKAIEAAVGAGRALGLNVATEMESVDEDYKAVARRMVERLRALRASQSSGRVCLLSGGEVLCRVDGNGVGGRNQEFVLYSASLLRRSELVACAVLSCGTDGIDGNSTAAGAVADCSTGSRSLRLVEEASGFISANDSHSFFKKHGGLIVTGPSGTNVRDLRLMLA